MRLAVYNVENLFNRAKILQSDDSAERKSVLNKFAELNALLAEINYTAARKKKIAQLLKDLGLAKSDQSEYVILRRNRGALVKRLKSGGLEVVADGRADWVGSIELVETAIDHESMLNTARVIEEVDPHVLAVVEADSRPALQLFMDKILKAVGSTPFPFVMLIDGNDPRGIDVGISSRKPYAIGSMRSHVDDRGSDGKAVFSRDCAEYYLETPGGKPLLVMVNHFKSKGYGSQADNDARRKAQAKRVRALCDARLDEGFEYIAVVGDLNDTPASDALKPLHGQNPLKDVFTHPKFDDDGGYPGTYGLCNASNKIDYMLLSPKLFSKVTAGGVFRKGMWPGSKPKRWDTYPELKKESDAGSDHACLWVDLAI